MVVRLFFRKGSRCLPAILGCLLLVLLAPRLAAEDDLYAKYRREDLVRLAQTTLMLERLTEADVADLHQLSDKEVDKTKANKGEPNGDSDHHLVDLIIKSNVTEEQGDAELKKMCDVIIKEKGLKAWPKPTSQEDAIRIRKLIVTAAAVDVSGLLRAQLIERCVAKKK